MAQNQTITSGDIPFVDTEQVDGFEADLGGVGAELVERNLFS